MNIIKICAATLAVPSIFFAISCKSSQNILLNDYSPVAIQTVYSNSGMPWYVNSSTSTTEVDQEEEGLITGVINKAIDRNNPERDTAQERINLAADLLVQKMGNLGIEAITPQTHPNAVSYQKKGASFLDSASNYIPAEGYAIIKSNSNGLNRKIAEETGAKAELYIAFKFKKEKVLNGVHEVGVAARTELQVYGADAKNSKIIYKTYTSTSSKYADLHNSKWNRQEVCEYFPVTIENVINQFLMDFYDGSSPALDVNSAAKSQEQTVNLTIPSSVKTKDTSATEEDPVMAQKKETARRLLAKGMSVQETAEMTDLSEEEVQALIKQEEEAE